jgi:hypothetical protein
MTFMERTFMGMDSQEPRERLATFLRAQYREEHMIKRLADDIDCTQKAAANILSGAWPNSRHWAAIARRFGSRVLDAVFLPEIDAATARLEEEVRTLEEQLAQKKRLAREIALRRAGGSRSFASAPQQDGAAQLSRHTQSP